MSRRLRDPARGQPRPPLPRGGLGAPLAVPARPRPDHPFQRLPPAEAQDPGLRRARGRLLPHAADALDRGGAGGAHPRAGAGAERGAGRGGGAGARPRASAVRPYRRGRAAGADGALRRLRPQRAGDQDRDPARGALRRVRRAEPDLGDARGHRQAQRAGDRRRCPSRSPSTTRVHDLELDTHASAEAQVAAIADDIAYNNHDLADGLRAGLFTLEDLRAAAADRALRRRGRRPLAGAGAGAARARGAAAVLRAPGRGRAGRPAGRGSRRRRRRAPRTSARLGRAGDPLLRARPSPS